MKESVKESCKFILNVIMSKKDSSAVDLQDIIDLLAIEQKRLAEKERDEKAQIEEERIKHDKHVEEVTNMELPMDWENAFSVQSNKLPHANSIQDGLVVCLNNLGKVDIEYIAAITNTDCKAVISTLIGSIYQNPNRWEECFYKGWETSDEYLSGNLIKKWQLAKNKNEEYKGYFDANLSAI